METEVFNWILRVLTPRFAPSPDTREAEGGLQTLSSRPGLVSRPSNDFIAWSPAHSGWVDVYYITWGQSSCTIPQSLKQTRKRII